MRTLLLLLMSSTFVFTACGESGGQESPSGIAEAVVANFTDPEAMAELFPPG